MSINIWMDKQNMDYTYNRILFILKREGNSDVITWMKFEDSTLSEII